MTARDFPDQATLRQRLDYNPETGKFVWLTGRRKNKVAGYVTWGPNGGYVEITFDRRHRYRAHRLAWVWFYGDNIDGIEIDHADLDRSNNAIGNLRLATSAQQKQNKPAHPYSSSGLKGAFRTTSGKPWRSAIRIDGKITHLGMFNTAEEAHAAYAKAAAMHFGEFARAI